MGCLAGDGREQGSSSTRCATRPIQHGRAQPADVRGFLQLERRDEPIRAWRRCPREARCLAGGAGCGCWRSGAALAGCPASPPVERISPMEPRVVVYRTPLSADCIRAEELLRQRGIPYREVDVTNDEAA